MVRLAPLFIGQERLTDVVTPDSTPLIGHGRLYRNPNHSPQQYKRSCSTLEYKVEGEMWHNMLEYNIKQKQNKKNPNKLLLLKIVYHSIMIWASGAQLMVSCVKTLRKSWGICF